MAGLCGLLTLHFGNGAGGFGDGPAGNPDLVQHNAPFQVYESAIGDLNGDDFPDLILSDAGYVLGYAFNDGAGNFSVIETPPWRAPISLANSASSLNPASFAKTLYGGFSTAASTDSRVSA